MRTLPIVLAVTLAAGMVRAAAPPRSPVLAVLSEVEGNVTIREGPPSRRRPDAPGSLRRARFLQILKPGDRINVPAGAGAGFVCSNDRWVTLPTGSDQPLTEDLCRTGKPLPPGTYRRLAPVGGRLRSIAGAMVLERKTRGPEDEGAGVPLLLSPRNTAILEARPEIVWAPVSGATEYEVELVGPAAFRLRLDASEVPCGKSGEAWEESTVCKIPWPASAPDLPRGETFFLSVGARLGIASPLRRESEPSRIHRLSEERAGEVRTSLKKLKDHPLDNAAHQLLEADVYARAGVTSQAIVVFRKGLELREAPESRITLGDAYLAAGLLRAAARSYQAALDKAGDGAAQAAAEFGLGRVEYARRSFERAAEHFRRAGELSASVDRELMEAARQALREASARVEK